MLGTGLVLSRAAGTSAAAAQIITGFERFPQASTKEENCNRHCHGNKQMLHNRLLPEMK
ncbi:MAG: hypothetical protein PHI97_03285 [Desulfobulbus sp.]|nr:hypothetical protein [Desulfobulbus sp.]